MFTVVLRFVSSCNATTAFTPFSQRVSKIRSLLDEYNDISSSLQSELINGSDRRLLNRRLLQLSSVVNTFQSCETALKELVEVKSLLHQIKLGTTRERSEDKEFEELLRHGKYEIEKRIKKLNRKLIQSLVLCDVHDNSNVILEVAAGRTTGGDICQQFTREMFDMFHGFASFKGWNFKLLNYTPADNGGLHHAAVGIAGDNVHRWLKFEGGTHCVQRIPEEGMSSRMQRIHTGTMTVIVLPQPNDVDITLDPKDLRIDTFRSRGAGGQSVNTTDSAVRIVHIPTGGQSIPVREDKNIQLQPGQGDRSPDWEFMKGRELLEELISELQQHAERKALLKLVDNTSDTEFADINPDDLYSVKHLCAEFLSALQ